MPTFDAAYYYKNFFYYYNELESNEKQYWPKKQEGLGPAVDFKEEKCYSWIKASWPTLGKERQVSYI